MYKTVISLIKNHMIYDGAIYFLRLKLQLDDE